MATQHVIVCLLVLWMVFDVGVHAISTPVTQAPAVTTPATPLVATSSTAAPVTPDPKSITPAPVTSDTKSITAGPTTTLDPLCATDDPHCVHGHCIVDSTANTTCKCDVGYTDDTCGTETMCVSSPCQNGGTCRSSNTTYFHCDCPPTYIQPHCENTGTMQMATFFVLLLPVIFKFILT